MDREIVVGFLEESLDQISNLETLMIEFEQNPDNLDLVEQIFRPIHSIKGTAGFFQMGQMQKLAHSLENVLDLLRRQEILPSQLVTSVEISGFEELREICQRLIDEKDEIEDQSYFDQLLFTIDQLAQQKRDTNTEILLGVNSLKAFVSQLSPDLLKSQKYRKLSQATEHLEALARFQIEDAISTFSQAFSDFREELPPEASTTPGLTALSRNLARLDLVAATPVQVRKFRKTDDYFLNGIDVSGEISTIKDILNTSLASSPSLNMAQRLADALISLQAKTEDLVIEHIKAMRPMLELVLAGNEKFDANIQKKLKKEFQSLLATVTPSKGKISQKPVQEKEPPAMRQKTMRVSEEEIDGFMHFVGELVVVSDMFNYISKMMRENLDPKRLEDRFRQANETFNELSQKLIDSLLKVRQLPMEGLLKKIPGLARSVADKQGKQVRVTTKGNDVKVDKGIYDLLDHPLTHLIRNAVDHGLETPELRVARGKPEVGTIKIEVTSDGDWVSIAIQDDGGGISVEKVKAKALERKMFTPEELDKFSEEEIINLILLPGFSTVEQVSEISGRGVGMDVVKKNIEEASGKLNIISQWEKGTTFQIRFPKSSHFMIIEGISAQVGKVDFIFPIESVLTVFSPPPQALFKANQTEVVRYNQQILPVLRLHELFQITPEKHHQGKVILVIVRHETQDFAVLVDAFLGTTQVVVKELGLEKLGSVYTQKDISGGAIMGHGGVALILDTEQLKTHIA